MKAVEIKSKTDKNGNLKINFPLNKSDKKVRILILMDDNPLSSDEELWLKTVSNNPVFDFLEDEAENVYTLSDGEPFND
ncbi:MAG: hypothetical protein U5L09_06505 [Bacteroidales bacterium]|nr:hypothetical protein [Bacteroidales bacterium]